MSCVFFFFKQKTAYEMRISDWSSDVCSSDLTKVDYAEALLGVRATTARDWPRLPEDVKKLFTAYAAGLNHYADKHADEVRLSGLFPVTGEDEIGRASCRERVCQYV